MEVRKQAYGSGDGICLLWPGGTLFASRRGRFATPDPVGFSDGPNLYAYVHNSPVVLVDPYGLTAVEDEADTDDWTRSRSNEEIWKLIHGFEAIPEIGREFIHGDFSRIRDAPWREIAERVASESTKALYCAAAMYPATRIAGAAIRAGAAALRGRRRGWLVEVWLHGRFRGCEGCFLLRRLWGEAEGRLAIPEARATAGIQKRPLLGLGVWRKRQRLRGG